MISAIDMTIQRLIRDVQDYAEPGFLRPEERAGRIAPLRAGTPLHGGR